MKRLIPGFVAAAVLMAALPAAAQTVPEPGLLRGMPLRMYTRSFYTDPWEPTDTYRTEATDGDILTSIEVGNHRGYRYTWDVPMRITRVIVAYRQNYSRQGYLQVQAFDQDGGVLWTQELPKTSFSEVYHQVYDVDLRLVGSLMVYRAGTNGWLYVHELEAYGEPEALPPPPTGLRAMPGDTEVTIAWDPVAGASYDVEMRPADAGGEWQLAVTGLTATSYTVTGLENDRPYDFRVRAVIAGLIGDWSEPVTATPTTPAPPPPPPPPAQVRATAGDGQVTVTWEPVEGADSYDLDDRPADGRWNTRARGLTDTRYTVTGLSNGVPYEFRVRSVGPGGPGDWSESVTATPRAPARWGWFGAVVDLLPDYLGDAVGGIGPIVLIPAAVTLVTALGKLWLARMGV